MEETAHISKKQKLIGLVMVFAFLAVSGYYLYSRTTLFSFGKGVANATKGTSVTELAGVENPNLEVTLFCDLSLPDCLSNYYTLQVFREDFPNDISITYAYYGATDNGRKAAIASLVAGAFTDQILFHDKLIDYFDEWYENQDPVEAFIRYAEELGLNTEDYSNALTSALDPNSSIAKSIEKANKKAASIGVSTVPTVFINNTKLTEPIEYFILEEYLDNAYPEEYLESLPNNQIDLDFDLSDEEFIEDPYDTSGAEEEPESTE